MDAGCRTVRDNRKHFVDKPWAKHFLDTVQGLEATDCSDTTKDTATNLSDDTHSAVNYRPSPVQCMCYQVVAAFACYSMDDSISRWALGHLNETYIIMMIII